MVCTECKKVEHYVLIGEVFHINTVNTEEKKCGPDVNGNNDTKDMIPKLDPEERESEDLGTTMASTVTNIVSYSQASKNVSDHTRVVKAVECKERPSLN